MESGTAWDGQRGAHRNGRGAGPPPDGVWRLSRPRWARYPFTMTLSRTLLTGGALLLVAGIVLALVGAKIAAFALCAAGLVLLTSWGFLLVGLSEEREREREEP